MHLGKQPTLVPVQAYALLSLSSPLTEYSILEYTVYDEKQYVKILTLIILGCPMQFYSLSAHFMILDSEFHSTL